MVQIFCKLCLQSVSATDWKPHIAQKQHLQQLPCKIVVTGSFKDKVDEVYTYFGKFGGIRGQNVAVHGDKIAIEYRFWDARVYSKVIHQEHKLFGQQIEISWYKKVKAGPLQHVVQDEKMSNERFVYCKLAIINTTKGLSTFAEQIEMFQKQLNIIKNEMEEHRKTIHDDLTTALAPNFPHNKIHFFGSTITELEIHDSDLNIYVDNTDSQLATLELIKDLITKNENFTNVLLYSENDNSVVKCRHINSRISCEVTIRNELPVGNSELIKYYLTLDEKLKPLMLFIKFWADCYDLRGENLFSSYALYLMVIFYLQREPHKLPSVLDLQKDMPSDEIDGWNCAFGPVEFTSPSLENSTILDLVTGFFRFYSNFDYMSHVISLYFGSSIGKTRFLEPHDLPECFDDYVKQNQVFPVNSGICIQDPFEHSRNVSIFVPLECVGKFTAVCRNSLELIKTKEAELFYRLLLAENPVNQFHLEKNEWDAEGIKELVLKILREIFCCQVEEIKSEEAHVTYSCQGQYNIWDKRSDFLKNIMTEFSSEIKQEIAVTSRIIKDSAPNFTWEMGLQLTFDKDKVTFVLTNENSVLLHLGHFLYVKLAKLLTENPPNEGLSPGIPMDTEEIHGVEEKPQIEDQSQAEEISKRILSASAKQNLENAVFESGSENAQQANDSNIATNFANEDLDVEEGNSSIDVDMEEDSDSAVAEMVKNGNETSNETPVSYFSSSALDWKILTDALGEPQKDADFAKEITNLFRALKSNKNETIKNCHIISNDLNLSLRAEYPDHSVHFFGSKVSGLALPGSNFDIYVDLKQNVDDEVQTLTLIKDMLTKSKKFCEGLVISNCIKCQHVFTKQFCVLNIRKREAVSTTKLLEYYLSIDEKIRLMMLLIKLWAHRFDLVLLSFSSYSLYLMVIFYLQQEPFWLHSVATLQKDTSKKGQNWNCTFRAVYFTKHFKRFKIWTLVAGFFRFYTNFDYINYVISPYFGAAIEKSKFLKPYDLPECFHRYVKQNQELVLNSGFCIQDPFEHCENVSLTLDLEKSGKFASLCRHASQVMLSRKNLLHKLLADATLLNVQIMKMGEETENEWIGSVKKHTEFILRNVLGCEVLQTVVGYKCYQHHNIWDNRTNVLKSLLVKSPQMDKDVAVTSYIVTNHQKIQRREIYVRFIFRENPRVIDIEVRGFEEKLHVDHVLYTRLVKLLKNEDDTTETVFKESQSNNEDRRLFIVQSLVKGQSFAEETAIMETKFRRFQTKMEKNRKVISDDLSAILIPVFPQIRICFYIANITCLNMLQKRLKIHLADVSPQAATLELVKNMIGKNEKFSTSKCDGVIVCKHVSTGTCFDLSMQNNLHVCTSELIKYYMSLDDKLPKLMMIIKFWFDANTKSFPNNAVYLMVIFYLQQEPYKLPSVADLQKNVFVDLVDGWNCAFSQAKCQNNSLQNVSLLDLVTGFFRYYDSVDYFSYVISPYFGSLIEKTHFLKPYNLPDCYQQYVNQNEEFPVGDYIDIQHPFEHSRNIVESHNFLHYFTARCRHAFILTQSSKVSLHDLFYRNAENISVIIIENNKWDRKKWTEFVKVVTVKTLSSFVDGTLSERRNNQETVYIGGVRKFWEHRTQVAKNLNLPPEVSDIDKEIAITRAVNAQFPAKTPAELMVLLKFKQNPCRAIFTVKPKRSEMKYCMQHFIYAKLLKFWKIMEADADLDVGGSSSNLENPKRTDQVAILQEKVQAQTKERDMIVTATPMEVEATATRIEDPAEKGIVSESEMATKIEDSVQLIVTEDTADERIASEKETAYPAEILKIVKTEDTTSESETSDFAVIPKIVQSADIASEVKIEDTAEKSEMTDYTEVPMEVESPAAEIDVLKEAPTFVEQVAILQKILQIDSSKQKQNCEVIRADLFCALAWLYRRSKIHFFGSSITGVDMPGSDVNIYVSGVKSDEVSEINQLSAIQTLLKKSEKFKDVSVIPGSKMKMPIVKCVHCSTLMTCELNIKDKLAVCNSELLKYYLSLGENLKPLLRMIKYWAGCHGMVGENFFSPYALSLMVIFFLQQDPYKVPTVVDLQKKSTEIVDDWNCAFATPQCTNFLKTSTLDLAKGFFKFYSDFDYFSFVISPFFGSAIAKTRFLQPYTLPGVFRLYMTRQQVLSVDTGICIQDPFEHSKNISASISLDAAGKFSALCRCAFQIMQHSEEEMLYKLVTQCPLCEFSVIKNDDRDDETWIALVDRLIFKTLTRVLSCNVYEMRQVDSGVVYGCRGESNVWDNRTTVLKSALKQLHRNTSAVGKEIAVTSRLVNPQKVSWTMTLHKTFNKNPFRVTVAVDAPNNAFYFCHFIYTRLAKFLQTDGNISIPVAPLQEKQNVESKKLDSQNDPSASKKQESSTVLSTASVTLSPPVVSTSTSSVSSAVPLAVSTSGEEKEASSYNVVIHPSVIVSSPSLNQDSLIQVEPRPILDRQQKKNILKKGDLPTFAAQVAHMYTYFRMDKDEIEKYEKIIHEDLTLAVTPNFAFDKIHFFGSTVLGLFADDGSVDVYIEKLEQPGKYNLLSTLNLLKDCLRKSGRFLSGSVDASGVSCTNLRSQMRCKIHIDNKLSIHNTQLIEYYLTLDSKLHSFMFTVKTWAEFCQLKLHGRFSTYILYLMVIFYLQQEPYNFPTVADVQRNAPPNMVDGWNGTFVPLPFTNQTLKDATILDLVIGFFKFYSNFNFFSYVISPFCGSAIERTRFLKPFDLPSCYANYTMGNKFMMVNSPLCVQDPFEHSRNVSSSVSLAWASRFAAMCRSIPAFISLGEKQLLYKLMCQCQSGQTFDHRAFVIEKQENMNELIWIRTIKGVISSILTDFLGYKSVSVKEKRVIESTQLMTLTKREVSQLKEESGGDIDQILFICRDQQKPFKNATSFEKNAFVGKEVLNVEAVIMRNPTRVRLSVVGAADKLHVTHFIYIKMLSLLEKTLPKEKTNVVVPEVSEPYKYLVKGTFERGKLGNTVLNYFAQFGIAIKKNSGDLETTIEGGCANLTTYRQVIQTEHVVCGEKLRLFPLVPLREKRENAHFAAITKEIIECPTFPAQIDVLLCQRTDNRTVIQNDLNSALFSKFGTTKTYFFDVNVPSENLDIYVGNIKHRNNRVATLEELTDCVSNAGFDEVLLISNSITCIHVKTQTFCVISFGDKMAEISSDLIKYYLSLDEKILHFMMIAKFWADSYDLIGVDCFSNYAFSLMVIFFLQQEYDLPSVKTLQKNTTANLVKGWNCAYAEFVELTKSPIKNAAILELVTGFFKFYSKFDYISYVLSPYLGAAVEKIRFLKPYDLPKGYNQFVTRNKDLEATSGLCIQDFFEHSRNVSVSVSLDFMGNFTNLCRSALQLIDKGEELLLYNLLLHCQNGAMVDSPAFILENDDRNEQEWEQTVKKITKMALSDILNCKVYEVVSADSKSVSFGCVGKHRVWDNRINIWKNLPTELSHVGIEREVAITHRVVKDFPQRILWNVSVKLTFMTNHCRAKILFAKMSDSFSVNHVCHFLYTRLLKLLAEEETFVSTEPLIDLTKDDDKISNEDGEPQPKHTAKPVEEGEISEEDDDVPSDFFDDFAKEDFLMGLDIVDAWDDDSKVGAPKEKTKGKRRSREKSVSKEKEKRRKKSSKSKSPVQRCRRSRSRSRSRSRRRRRSRSKSRSRKRSRSRSRSRRRSRSRSRDGKRDRKKDRTDEPLPPGTESTADIERMKRKHRSTSSSDTDKSRDQKWKEKRHSRSCSRSRSRSPCSFKKRKRMPEFRGRRTSSDSLSPRPKSRKLEATKRKSFLEEIREKLNEIKTPVPPPPPTIHNLPPYVYRIEPIPPSMPPPLMVTSSYGPSVPLSSAQSYDPSFFIGGTTVSIVTNPIVHTAPPPSPPFLPPASAPSIQQKVTPKPLNPKEKNTEDDVARFFAQKKISLSDFLSIAAKREAVAISSSPGHKQKKDKVISRCKDVLKLLTCTPKTGPLSVELEPPSPPHDQPQLLYQSPLKRTPEVRFSFTTPPKWNVLAGCSFSEALTKILQKVGLEKEKEEDDVDDLVDSVARVLNSYGSISKETAAKILKVTLLGVFDSEVSESTEKFDVGIQCMVDKESVGVQVQGEEPSPGGLLSNDSIAYLTSAYLLGRNRSTSSNGSFDGGKEGALYPRRRL